jgi:phage tail-like protein
MAVYREVPYGRARFEVDLGAGDDPSTGYGFFHVVPPRGVITVADYQSGSSRQHAPHEVPGPAHMDRVLMRRGLTGALDLFAWWKAVLDGQGGVDRTVRIYLLDDDGGIVLTWTLFGAWPAVYGVEPLVAGSSDQAVEFVELAYDSFEVE